ncbi:PIN domain-containing protein [Dyadobacter sp. 3J3]|uniref:PIN domain-containing protein n=1 Tax=Dyadobacter sp. 3J3 TaxID=2606600 RepID=UPI001E50FC3C|nr:PIN domain-containing protein [Dyadobacter sp. 3J3]
MKIRESVFCDTSFFIRLLDKNDPHHGNAKGYFRYFTENGFPLMISTIAIAEYCVRGKITDLPLRNLQIVPFNLDHALRTSEFAKLIFENKSSLDLKQRKIIPNDTKLFAQADIEKSVLYYLSSDTESSKIFNLLRNESDPKFQFINLSTPYDLQFGILDL